VKRRMQGWVAAVGLLLVTTLVSAQPPASSGADPIELLMSGQYSELDSTYRAVQDAYKRGDLSDEQLLVAFRPFYRVSYPGLERHFDAWVERMPRSYVARLARGIHYKYVGVTARGTESIYTVPDANLRLRKKAYARAADDLSASLDLDDKPLLSYVHLMDSSGSLLLFTSSRRLLDAANEIDPHNLIVRRKFLASLAGRRGGGLDEMRAFVQENREAGLPAGRIRKLEAFIQAEQGWDALLSDQNYALAERLSAEVLAVDPDDISASRLHINALMGRRKCDEAIAASTRLLEIDPENRLALSNRGLCYVRQKQEEQGIADYRRSAALGDAWANKELARLHWQGRMVPKDRKLALELLRRAAESGDPDAQREFARATGEKIVTKLPNGYGIIPFVGMAILLGALGAAAAFWKRRTERDDETYLSHPFSTFATSATCFGFCIALIIVSEMYPNRTANIFTTLCFLVFAVASLPYMLAYLFTSYEVTKFGLTYSRIGRSPGQLDWEDVRAVTYSSGMSRFNLATGFGGVVRISTRLRNFPILARTLLAHVAPERIEPWATAALREAQKLNG
jgi:tetratricopeptide (TPR) repeat protein